RQRRAARSPAERRRDLPRGDPRGRAVRPDLAGVRGTAADQIGGGDGRRPHVRQRGRAARRHEPRRHDGGLVPVPARSAGPDLEPDHQRSAGREPGGLRRELQAAGDDRVGVSEPSHVGTSARRHEPSHHGMSERLKIRAWQAAVISAFLAATMAAPSIANEFVADDQWVVANREVLVHPSSVAAVLKEPYWPAGFGGVMWRPAVLSSFAIDYQLASSPHWFHAVNVLWAALVAALFALLASDLAVPVVGLTAGLLFAVHPVHVEAVANVVGRAEMMAAAGYAVALLCALRAERDSKYLMGVVLGAALAITSKEIAVTLPAAVVLAYITRRENIRQAWRPVVAATVPIVAYFIVHGLVGIRTFYAGGLAVGLEHLGFFERAWAMVRLSLEWWRLFLFPAHLSADYSPGELTVSTGFTVWHVLG